MDRKAYPSDLTDAQWNVLAPLLPAAKPGGRPRTVDIQEVVNGILYVVRNGWYVASHASRLAALGYCVVVFSQVETGWYMGTSP